MNDSREKADSHMDDTLCEKTKMFMTTINDCDKTDCCEYLPSNSIHLDISIKTEPTKLNGLCVTDSFQELQANYKSPQNCIGTKVQTPKDLSSLPLTSCSSYDSKSLVSPVKECNEQQLQLDLVPEEHFSLNDKNFKKMLQVQIERLPKELVDKLLVQYKESVGHSKQSCNENLSNMTVSSLEKNNNDRELEQLQIKPSYVLLQRLSVNHTKYHSCQKESEPPETLDHLANINNTGDESNGQCALTDISTKKMQRVIQEKAFLDCSDQDLENVTNNTNNNSTVNKVSARTTEGCKDEPVQKPDCSLRLSLQCESKDTICNTDNFKPGKQNRRSSKRDSDRPLSIKLHDKACSRRIYNKTAKQPTTSLIYTNYKVDKQHCVNNESRKRKYQSRNNHVDKVNNKNPQQRRSSRRRSIDRCEIKNKPPVGDQYQIVNENSLAFKKFKGRRKPYTKNKNQNKHRLEMQLPKEGQSQSGNSFLIVRKRKPLQIDVKGKTHQNISSNNKENNRSIVRNKKHALQHHHLDQQISVGYDSIIELQVKKQFNQVLIQLNDSLEKTTSNEGAGIEPKHLKTTFNRNVQLNGSLQKTTLCGNSNMKQKQSKVINNIIEVNNIDKPVRPSLQCRTPSVKVRNMKTKCQNAFDSCWTMDYQYESKSHEIKECRTSHKRRKVNLQPQTLAGLALQSFFGRHFYT